MVLIQTGAVRQLVSAACGFAIQQGVRIGHTLAEARALCPGLQFAEHKIDRDRKSLLALARKLIQFSPVVTLEGDDSILIDVTGCHRLFGGWTKLLNSIQATLDRLAFRASIALAPTAGAAWAFARVSSGAPRLITDELLLPELKKLPPFCLRLSAETADRLHQVGVESIADLLKLPREMLPSRFGRELLLRLDQALGHIPEQLLPIPSLAPIRFKEQWDGPVDNLDSIWLVLQQLLDQVIKELHKRGCGARTLLATFFRPYAAPIQQKLNLSAASRDRSNIFNLLRCALETIETKIGFDGIELAVPLFEKLSEEQITLDNQSQPTEDREWNHLIERLQIRLGQEAVLRAHWHESYIPERSCTYEFAGSGSLSPRERVRVRADATNDVDSRWNIESSVGPHPRPLPEGEGVGIPPRAQYRPLTLFPPREIRVTISPSESDDGRPIAFTDRGHAQPIVFSNGPERIAGEWWLNHNKTRDYYEIETESAERWWIFKVLESRRWFAQGKF